MNPKCFVCGNFPVLIHGGPPIKIKNNMGVKSKENKIENFHFDRVCVFFGQNFDKNFKIIIVINIAKIGHINHDIDTFCKNFHFTAPNPEQSQSPKIVCKF